LTEGCYLLRSNVTDWTAEDLWNTYMQLTEAEAAFLPLGRNKNGELSGRSPRGDPPP